MWNIRNLYDVEVFCLIIKVCRLWISFKLDLWTTGVKVMNSLMNEVREVVILVDIILGSRFRTYLVCSCWVRVDRYLLDSGSFHTWNSNETHSRCLFMALERYWLWHRVSRTLWVEVEQSRVCKVVMDGLFLVWYGSGMDPIAVDGIIKAISSSCMFRLCNYFVPYTGRVLLGFTDYAEV